MKEGGHLGEKLSSLLTLILGLFPSSVGPGSSLRVSLLCGDQGFVVFDSPVSWLDIA